MLRNKASALTSLVKAPRQAATSRLTLHRSFVSFALRRLPRQSNGDPLAGHGRPPDGLAIPDLTSEEERS